MSDNPLEDTPEREARIREEAYHLWEKDGKPNGRDLEYWERARELVGIQESPGAGQVPVQDVLMRNTAVDGTPIEEAEIQENLGETPGRLTDQGERAATPMTRDKLRKSGDGR